MVKQKIGKRKITKHTAEQMQAAVKLVIEEDCSIRQAALQKNIPFQTLARYVAKQKEDPNFKNFSPQYDVNRVFSTEQEAIIAKYLKKCSDMAYGLTPKQVRELAYDTAVANNLNYPKTWKDNGIAGQKWMRHFLKRHTELSIRKPEACSLTRLTSFNKSNVDLFYSNLEKIYNDEPLLKNPSRIFNLDETATTCVQNPRDIIASKGVKQVYRATSGERGELVTTCCIVSADGNHLPPILVFPRKFFKDAMTFGAPPNTLGLANPSGWMTAEIFLRVMDHFIEFSKSSEANPSLLIFDNHDSHFSIEAIKKARSCGVTILTLPPHSSNKMQPLDISVFGPFKQYYNSACDDWMSNHPGKTITIYNIAECVGAAFSRAMAPNNIISGFRKAGIHPFNPNVFTDADFAISSVTDRPPPCEQLTTGDINQNVVKEVIFEVDPAVLNEINIPPQENVVFKSPEEIRPLPKAEARKQGTRGRKRARSVIATDENVIMELEEKKKEKETKVSKKVKIKKEKTETEETKTLEEKKKPKKSANSQKTVDKVKKKRSAKK